VSSADEASEMKQVIRQSGAERGESDAQDQLPLPQQPEREPGAKDNAGGNEHAMKRDHLGAWGLGVRD
jgi:hypothetical protein